jgi:hypothetical protein
MVEMGFKRMQGKKSGDAGKGFKDANEDGRNRRPIPKARLHPNWFRQHLSVSGPRNGKPSRDFVTE